MSEPLNSIDYIKIYAGEGIFCHPDVPAVESMIKTIDPSIVVETVFKDTFQPDKWHPSRTLLVLPGGHSSKFEEQLGKQVEKIKAFLKCGGKMLAFCGGAFWACKHRRYNGIYKKSTLDLFQGIVEGPFLEGGDPYRHSIETMRWKDGREISVLYSGGGYFKPITAGGAPYEAIGTLPLTDPSRALSIIKVPYAAGCAILSCGHVAVNSPFVKSGKLKDSLSNCDEERTKLFHDLLREFG